MKKVSDMISGETGVVKKIDGFGALRRRIIDMGVMPGTVVKMIKSAPLGDPVEINLHGYDLSIRKSEANNIELFNNDSDENIFLKQQQNHDFKVKNYAVPFMNQGESCHYKNSKIFKAALIGNPNSGKTTLFNGLTGSYQYVGNWPGVTVERKEGRIKNVHEMIDLVDLPGVYSLSPYSPEEIVTRNYILNEAPDVIINIIDATNLERNLYLTTQLLELDCKIILVLNMTDLLLYKGKKIDYRTLENELGVPVVPVSAGKNQGIDDFLKKLLVVLSSSGNSSRAYNFYSPDVEHAIESIDKKVSTSIKYIRHNRFRFVKIFEDDPLIMHESNLNKDQVSEIVKIRNSVSKLHDKDKDIIIADERYSYIAGLCKRAVKNIKNPKDFSFSNKLDSLITGKYTAFPIFVILILSIFYVTFGPFGLMLKSWCENFINMNMRGTLERILNYLGASVWSKSLALDAVIGGVGAVISFLPQIALLFTLLSLLEDCGYMARAAFIMDKPFRKIGLSGRAFVPLIMGFGCSVPAILGTKILENKKDKNLTIFLIPFMSCSAKMPVYLLFASAFFPKHQPFVIFALYLFGIMVAVFTAYLFKGTLFKGESSPFIMEMPEYKLPSLKNVGLNVWDKTKDFVERAGTVILVATVVVWFFQSFDFGLKFVSDNSQSMLAAFGNIIAPIFNICGFGWRACVALLTGIMAKESIVSTFSVLYPGGNGFEPSSVLPRVFSFYSAISFLVFVLLYNPCIAALSAIHKEFKDWKLTVTSIIYQLFIAYVLSAITFQVLNLFSNFLKI